MKAITMTQPWASLLVSPDPDLRERPIKPFETRSWRLRKETLPMRIAVHAALGIREDLRRSIISRVPTGGVDYEFNGWHRVGLRRAGLPVRDPWFAAKYKAPPETAIPLGAIVGCVTVIGIIPTDEVSNGWIRHEVPDLVYFLGDFSPGRWAWVCVQPKRFETPIPCRGMQGLWTVPGPIGCDVEEADRAVSPRFREWLAGPAPV